MNGGNPLLKNKNGKIPIEMTDNQEIKEMLFQATSNFTIDDLPENIKTEPFSQSDNDQVRNSGNLTVNVVGQFL